MRFYPLEKLINLHDHYARTFRIDHRSLLLLQRAGEVFLIEANCPHRQQPLDVASVDGDVIQCPMHQYRFSLRDGAVLHATDSPCRPLLTFPVVYAGNEVGVMLEEHGGT